MRPNNQNKRSRGRSNSNRRHGSGGGNPLSRNYESNGPDIRVRGNAATITEKYVQLARDAHSSGDSVLEQSYLQFAEHYLRIVSAAQALIQTQNQQRQERQAAQALQDAKQENKQVANEAEKPDDQQVAQKDNLDKPDEVEKVISKVKTTRPRRRPVSKPAQNGDVKPSENAKVKQEQVKQEQTNQTETNELPAFLTSEISSQS